MRKAEIYNLEWINVNLEQNFITVTAQEAKNKKIRRIPINKSLRELLLKLNLTRNGNRHVFENPKTGKPYTDLKRGWHSALERAGINDLRFHDLRHKFASHFLMNGGDLYTTQRNSRPQRHYHQIPVFDNNHRAQKQGNGDFCSAGKRVEYHRIGWIESYNQ